MKTEDLIKKYLLGSLNDEECDQLVKWIHEDHNNLTYFRNYCSKWEGAVDSHLENSYEQLLNKRLLREAAAQSVPRSNSYSSSFRNRKYGRRIIRYAALILIGILTSTIVQFYVSERENLQNAVQWVHAETLTGQKAKLMLPDSSEVWMNAETKISFASGFAGKKDRIVKLEGEAYFKVKAQHKNNFIVRSNDYDILVKGTEFNVMAYEDFNRTETTLVNGLISVVKDNMSVNVKPGERIVYSDNSLVKSKAHIRQATLWKENKFYFDNVPFTELVRRLERWYDVNITVTDSQLKEIYYSGYFKNEETVWQVLDVIQLTTPIQYERKDFREIIIKKK